MTGTNGKHSPLVKILLCIGYSLPQFITVNQILVLFVPSNPSRHSLSLTLDGIQSMGNAGQEGEGDQIAKTGSNGRGHIVRVDVEWA